jgi:hypothetical protein
VVFLSSRCCSGVRLWRASFCLCFWPASFFVCFLFPSPRCLCPIPLSSLSLVVVVIVVLVSLAVALDPHSFSSPHPSIPLSCSLLSSFSYCCCYSSSWIVQYYVNYVRICISSFVMIMTMMIMMMTYRYRIVVFQLDLGVLVSLSAHS